MKWYKHPMLWGIVVMVLFSACLGLWLRDKTALPAQELKQTPIPWEEQVLSDTLWYSQDYLDTAKWVDSLHIIQTDSAGNIIKEFILYYR